MLKTIRILCASLFLIALSAPSWAQGDLTQFENDLHTYNQTQMTLSPRYKSEQKMFAMRVVDKSHQIVGKVDDIKIDEGGTLAKLVSQINRIGRYDNTVENDAYQVSFLDNISAFQVPVKVDGSQDVSPEALAAVSPAAGGGNLYSLKGMIGADVRRDSGPWVGQVKHVIFNEDGDKIIALMIENVPGASHYKEYAMPFDPQLVSMRGDYGDVEFRVNNDAAKAVEDYAEAHR